MKRFDVKRVGRLITEITVLLAIYFLGSQIAAWLHVPIPGGVMGMALLLLAFALGWVKPATLQLGAGVLMAEMLLFFIPALMSLLDYGALVRNEGWRILLVIAISTLLTLGTTALVVDRVYRFEQRMMQKRGNHD